MTHAGGKADFFPLIFAWFPCPPWNEKLDGFVHTDFSEYEPHLHIMCSLFRSHCLITTVVIPSSFYQCLSNTNETLCHVIPGKEFSKQHISLLWSQETGGYFGCSSTHENFGRPSTLCKYISVIYFWTWDIVLQSGAVCCLTTVFLLSVTAACLELVS
jgi:hypothetical protein